MDKQETSVMLKCDHNYTTIWGRIKSAMKILFGKSIYYSDVYIDKPEKFRKFVEGSYFIM